MRRWTKTICLLLAVLMLSAALSGGLQAKAAGGTVQMGDVVQLGDYEKGSLHIVFYPKVLETSDQSWPLIIWANGTMCAPVLYTQLMHDLANQGYVVVTSSNVMSADGKDQIKSLDWILSQSEREDSVFYGKIDGSRVAAMGHSQGGRSTVNAAASDARIPLRGLHRGQQLHQRGEEAQRPHPLPHGHGRPDRALVHVGEAGL